ncbi:MAG: hypothetical protein ACOVOQ_06120 [Flavobacterium sp.]
MKKLLLLFFISNFCSCNFEQEIPGFRFDNFENTPIWDLAKAVRDGDIDEIKNQVLNKKVNIDYQESYFGMTLLSLAIVNK